MKPAGGGDSPSTLPEADVVFCSQHNADGRVMACRVQLDGSHQLLQACTCERDPLLCPVDDHRIKYLVSTWAKFPRRRKGQCR